MREPVRILSDLHLGHPASRIQAVEQLRPLLTGAGTLIFNGDSWQELARAFRPKSEKMLGELKQLCAELGVDPVFLSGNHDPGWSGKGWVELGDGKILVTHGDAVLWAGSPWSREAFAREAEVRRLWDEHHAARDDAGERLELARRVALALKAARHPKGRSFLRRAIDAVTPPQRALEIISSWVRHPVETEGFASHYFPRSGVAITGHFHWSGVWRVGGRLVINLGAHVYPHSAAWAEWSGGWLRCGPVTDSGAFQIGPATHVWRFPGAWSLSMR